MIDLVGILLEYKLMFCILKMHTYMEIIIIFLMFIFETADGIEISN